MDWVTPGSLKIFAVVSYLVKVTLKITGEVKEVRFFLNMSRVINVETLFQRVTYQKKLFASSMNRHRFDKL